MARSSSGGVAIRYVLPVLWMTSRLAVMGRMVTSGVAIPGCSLTSMNALLLLHLFVLSMYCMLHLNLICAVWSVKQKNI